MYDLEDSSLSSSPQSEELLELLSSTLVNVRTIQWSL